MKTVLRNMISDYLEVQGASEKEYVLMGVGFKSLDESPGAKLDTTIYVHQSTASSSVINYETKFPFTADTISDEKAVMALYKVGRDHLTGANAEFNYVRVDLFEAPTPEKTYKARLFKVCAEISDFKGEGGEKLEVSGNLNAVGDPVQGTFNVETRKFTPTVPAV